MQLKILDGKHLRQMLLAGAALLDKNKQEVNALNVFPVPDGDTGTNMSLTVMAAAREIERAEPELGKVALALANGSLMGARGNSGVILSQLFRGFGNYLAERERATPLDLAMALQEGVKTAYRGVMKPVEGTILTVAKEGAKAALQAARRGEDVFGVLGKTVQKAGEALERTPEMLAVLRDAGVVDAGGKGLLYFFQGALLGLQGEGITLEEGMVSDEAALPEPVHEPVDLEYQYCTEFILKGKGLNIDQIRAQLQGRGDSLLAVGTSELVKVHIHTNHPGQVLELGVKWGTLHDIKIDNMAEQHQELVVSSPEEKRGELDGEYPQEVSDDGISIIAVALGDGIKAILESLGVEKVIDGGQTMNPSTEDLVKSIDQTRCTKVILLPNNKNIILAAKQAKELTERDVTVIPSKSIPQGIAALLAYNSEKGLEENQEAMTAALEGVQTGEVTYAARDSRFNGWDIQAGDILGLQDGKMVELGRDPGEVIMALLRRMIRAENEMITLYFGEDVSATEADEIGEKIGQAYPHCEVEVYHGGQPLYYYIFAVE